MRPDNEVDKERFEKLKETEMKRGRSEEKATEVSAGQVKELRAREGRSKEEEPGPDVKITTTSS
jgi:hypothetical protein